MQWVGQMNTESMNFFNTLCAQGFARLGCVFKTNNEEYFYDSGTGKVFACGEIEAAILKALLETSRMNALKELPFDEVKITQGLENLYNLAQEEHILMLPIYTEMCSNASSSTLNVNQIILELTQDCNFRCRYCIFHEGYEAYRSFHNKKMDWETAKKAIDYAIKQSNGTLNIGFYGGEPLLNYDVLKRSIEYCRSNYSTYTFSYSITSNLSLVTEDMACFLATIRNITILCSIDGPKDIHDENRVQTGGKGSFDQSIHGLNLLVRAFGPRVKDVLTVNTVVCPPYDENKFNQLKAFFENKEFFPEGMNFRYSYVSHGSLKDTGLEQSQISVEEFYAQSLEVNDPFKNIALRNLCQKNAVEYEKKIELASILKMQNRFFYDEPLTVLSRNGCCNPGYERIFVSVEGVFKVCEKIGESPAIGDVNQGIDKEAIEAIYHKQYDVCSLPKCNQCWALHICEVCYATCFNNQGIDMHKKQDMCHAVRCLIRNQLIEYYTLLEERPDIIDEVCQVVAMGE